MTEVCTCHLTTHIGIACLRNMKALQSMTVKLYHVNTESLFQLVTVLTPQTNEAVFQWCPGWTSKSTCISLKDVARLASIQLVSYWYKTFCTCLVDHALKVEPELPSWPLIKCILAVSCPIVCLLKQSEWSPSQT